MQKPPRQFDPDGHAAAPAPHLPITLTVTDAITVRLATSVAETVTLCGPPVRSAGALNMIGPVLVDDDCLSSSASAADCRPTCDIRSALIVKPGLTYWSAFGEV